MYSTILILLVLLFSSTSCSVLNHKAPETSTQKSLLNVSQQSDIHFLKYEQSRRNNNDSEFIETLFIPEDPNRYAETLLHVLKFFEHDQSKHSINPVDSQEDLRNSTENFPANTTVNKNLFLTTDHLQQNNSSSKKKYLLNDSEGTFSSKEAVKNDEEREIAPVQKSNNCDNNCQENGEPDDEDLLAVANFGLNAMKNLYIVKEPMLYSMGLYLDSDDPANHLAEFNHQTEEARTLGKYGYAVLQSTTMFKRKFPDTSVALLLSRRRQNNPLRHDCPNRGVPKCPAASLRYRTSDGSCNNLQHLWWGSAMSPMQRFLPPVYDDGIQSIRRSVTGRSLPSARDVSILVHEDKDVPLASITHMLMQWGQFIDHDITATGQSRGFNGSVPQCCLKFGAGFQPPEFMHPECLPIAVNLRDSFFNPLGVRCLEFVRSGPAPKEDCELGPREQLSQVTSFLDASTVYSSNSLITDSLRVFRNGLLHYGKLQSQRSQLPKLDSDLCKHGSLSTNCFRAGDGRVGEQPALTSLHVVFLRLHNRIATKLAALNGHWNDEKLFQESRRIVGAILQHITYREFLPIVLGLDVLQIFDLTLLKKGYYNNYDPTVNPTIVNAFSTAAYRFGHSLVQHTFIRFNNEHRAILNNVSIHDEFTNPVNLATAGSVDRLLLGLINQPAQRRDEFISEELTNHLFQTPIFPFGMDLASINIQRGRDHGIPPYIQWREPCGLSTIKSFDDLERAVPESAVKKFREAYSSVEDIDLFTGGLAEKSVKGGLVGPTFACIIAQQFSNLRKGDRFWYENSGQENSFTPGQLQEIRRVSLAQILCATMDDIQTLQPFVFLTHDNLKNKRLSCEDKLIGKFNVQLWAEKPTKLRSRTGILEKFRRKTTTTPQSIIVQQNNSEQRFNIPQKPPKASIHQTNRIVIRKPLGPADNYTIVVQNNAINSPVFINDGISASNIKIQPSLNQQTQRKPLPQESSIDSGFHPPLRPLPTSHPLEHVHIPPPYTPYAFNDYNNPNPLNQGYQQAYTTKDVLFEGYPGTSPRPTLYTYYTNFLRPTTQKPAHEVDAYLINYQQGVHKIKPTTWPQYETEKYSINKPGYASLSNRTSQNNSQGHGIGYNGDFNYQENPYRPSNNFPAELKDSTSVYVSDNPKTSIVKDTPYSSNDPKDSFSISLEPAYSNSFGRPSVEEETSKNPSDYYSSTLQSTILCKSVPNNYQSYKSPYHVIKRCNPSEDHSTTNGGHKVDNLKDAITSELPNPIKLKINENVSRKPGQYYYDTNVLHRYPDKLNDGKDEYNGEETRSIDEEISSRKQQAVSLNGNNADSMNQTRSESSYHVGDNLAEDLSGGTEAYVSRQNQWVNPQEDSNQESVMEMPKIQLDKVSTVNELPKPMKLKNSIS